MKNGQARWRAALNVQDLTDGTRATTLAAIQKVAPQSTLMQIPAVAASYAALGTKGATLATNVTSAAALKQQYTLAVEQRDTSRSAFDLELVALKGLVDSNAASAGDIPAMGFVLFVPSKASQAPPDPPVGALIVRLGKVHGRARVSVPHAGNGNRFAAESSPDPIGIWTPLAGTGRQRALSGASGTKMWVRFATILYGMQSDWCAPVLVTLP